MQALAQGEAKGRAEGELKGRAEVLLKLLGRQFGAVPESAQVRIQAASIAELDRLLDRILSAKSLDDVLE